MNLKTRIRSIAMRRFTSAAHLEKQRTHARKQRKKRGDMPVVHYFHQVDDPYSHLTVQKLDQLKARYDLKFQPHLVSPPEPAYRGSADHFAHWARKDATNVAADYGTTFCADVEAPAAAQVALANAALAVHLDQDDFAAVAISVGETLWSGQSVPAADNIHKAQQTVASGDALRRKLGHYQGAMLYFDGEWYWGIDRIRLLEERLIAEGFDKNSGALCVPEPTPIDSKGADTSGILLEYFPSLRSPYTAIGHSRVVDLISRSGVNVQVRPVMPMMMRGIPAPREKQRYIMCDAGREGRAHGAPFGRIVDPFGEPVKRAFALFPAAAENGRGMEFVTAYLSAAWFDGIDITTERGLQQVIANADLDWEMLHNASQNNDWEAILADNLRTLVEENLWGVPSFRVSGGKIDTAYACWGQDRIWRVENEIARRA